MSQFFRTPWTAALTVIAIASLAACGKTPAGGGARRAATRQQRRWPS